MASPLANMGAGEGHRDGERSSGEEDEAAAAAAGGAVGLGESPGPGSDSESRSSSPLILAVQFERAAQRAPVLAATAAKEQLLYLYARYKQVKCGSCNTPKPGFFDFEGKQKWEAWKALGDKPPEQAMQEYIATVKKLDPTWNPQIAEKKGKEGKSGFGGPVVSSLYQEETIREEDKNIFDYCRENNIDHVTKAIRSKKVDVNMKDEKGRALLHWACDRGHKELASVLLQHTADVNSQDDEGQTALHYASTCEFSDIVELLLKSGADPTLRDTEGYLPEEVTDCRAITSMLQEHTAGKA
ncbi:acyl-CoA-binding domain-containing protein 6 isoform X2 [Hemicordylus capensis]|uniref:acyl-CoA-binding domain-containing protein 6 isoform X2 n=1 Tax=Hemicordylus capensis TaxID=884348 RepID=UPI0023039769|nr:acyl-CoA-binding domain-containing protein 6 isoform X2 [Hemicordylus capensis]